MTYVDGFVLPVPAAEFEAYKKLTEIAKIVWMEFGALSYVEARADDVPDGEITSFPLAVKKEKDDVIVFSFVTYKSREDRDRIMKKVMEDQRIKDSMKEIPAYMKRMIYGGFKTIVKG